ncbi:MAG: glycosyltransferase family 2 protein [Pseudomonadota bacterium]
MGVLGAYGLRLQRKRYRYRALKRGRQLSAIADRTRALRPDDIVLVTTLRNEKVRLPYFLRYYRQLGVGHFMVVDNGSTDGSREYLADQADVSLWATGASYKRARYGIDWMNALLSRYCHRRWALTVDVDEFFIYPFCDSRSLGALTDWLSASSIRSFGALLVDMYPRGPVDAEPYRAGQNPFEIAGWFDSGNYTITRNPKFGNLWIQGGARARVFFAEQPALAPALNKIPLVRWERRFAYVSSTHNILPRGLNRVYDEWGGEKASGCLLHAKFLDTFAAKSAEELVRKQHYAASREYRAYERAAGRNPQLWCEWSEKYVNWQQMETLGLMSKGNWA